MGRPSFREKLVSTSVQTIREKGLATIGVREIAVASGVGLGSFTNHFPSKEAFAIAVLEQYCRDNRQIIAATVEDMSKSPLVRVHAYFAAAVDYFAGVGWRFGCLAGNLALEAAEHSEIIRNRLAALFALWAEPFKVAIQEAQSARAIAPDIDPEQTALALLDAWQGAMMHMKVDRTPAALNRFIDLVLPALLPKAST